MFESLVNSDECQTIEHALALIKYIADEDKIEKILSNQQVIKTPVVRMGNKATAGFEPEKWKEFI